MVDRANATVDLSPTLPEGITREQCVALWLDLMDTCEKFLLAGLRREVGPQGDMTAAYQKWYVETMEEHDRMMIQMAENMSHRLEIMPGELVLQTLKKAWQTLEPLGLPMAIMGGLALATWRLIRATHDVDLLINLGSASIEEILPVLRQAGFRPKRNPPLLQIGPVRILQLLHTPPGQFVELQADLLLADSEYDKQALARKVDSPVPGFDMHFFSLSCEDLIIYKIIAGRILDRADVKGLLRVNRKTLNWDYLKEWIGHLGLERDWTEIWGETFPEEPSPLPV